VKKFNKILILAIVVSLGSLTACSTVPERTSDTVMTLNQEDLTVYVKRVKVIQTINEGYKMDKSIWEVEVTNHTLSPICFVPIFDLIGMIYKPNYSKIYSIILGNTIKVIGTVEDSLIKYGKFETILPGYGVLREYKVLDCTKEDIILEKSRIKQKQSNIRGIRWSSRKKYY